MTYEEYWFGPYPHMFNQMAKAFKTKKRVERNRDNNVAWLSGLYIRSAMDSSLSGAFSKERIDYMDAIDFDAMEKEEERLANMTEEERRLEEIKKYEHNSRSQIANVMQALKHNKKLKG